MPSTTRAAVLYRANEPHQIRELQMEDPHPGEVVVRVGAAGICASDHHVMEGLTALPLPSVLGHEGAGTVESVGPGVTGVQPGDRCILSFVSSCGHCSSCRRGRSNLCDTNAATGTRQYDGTTRLTDPEGLGIPQMGKLGVFAERLVCPAQACYPIPDDVPLDVGALIGCCVTTGVGAVVNTPDIQPGSTVAVFGCGGVGLNVVQGSALMSASRIIAVDIHDHKLEFARGFGATDTVNARDVDSVKAIRELTGGGADFAYDVLGSPETTRNAVDCLGKGGTAVVVGLAGIEDSAPINLVDLVRTPEAHPRLLLRLRQPARVLPHDGRPLPERPPRRRRPDPASLPPRADRRRLRRPGARRERSRRDRVRVSAGIGPNERTLVL